MPLRVIVWLVTTCYATLFMSGCRQGTGVIEVPIDANIPFIQVDHVLVGNAARMNEVEALPDAARNILNYLSCPDDFTLDTLNVLLSGNVRVLSLDDDRLIILDVRNDELIEYDRRSETSISFASRGEGPGELRFAKDLVTDGSTIYVPRGDRRISVFDCGKTPCVFERSFGAGAVASSLAVVGDDSLAILGSTPVPQDAGLQVSTKSQTAVHVMDLDGSPGHDFGAVYDTYGHWMLIYPFIDNGSVNYLAPSNRYVIAFERFPFLYIYDRAGELEKVFRVDDFIIGRQKYSTETGMLEVVFGDFSVLTTISIPRTDFVLVENTTRMNRRVEGPVVMWEISHTYYAVNLSTNESYYLGRIGDDVGSRLIVIPNGLLVEKEGVLLWVGV